LKVSNARLGIGLPLSHHMIPSAFFDSFIGMQKPPFVYLRTSNGPIEEMRNSLVRDAMVSNCTHLLLCDTDQVYPVDTVTKLLAHKLDVVGCLIFRRYPPFDPLLFKGELGKYQTIEEWEPGSLQEVDATGTGCLLFDMQVFRDMPAPWFRTRKFNGRPVGEDIGFCSDLKAAGYKIFVDTSIQAPHLSQIQITEATWRRYKKWEAEMAVEHGVMSHK